MKLQKKNLKQNQMQNPKDKVLFSIDVLESDVIDAIKRLPKEDDTELWKEMKYKMDYWSKDDNDGRSFGDFFYSLREFYSLSKK